MVSKAISPSQHQQKEKSNDSGDDNKDDDDTGEERWGEEDYDPEEDTDTPDSEDSEDDLQESCEDDELDEKTALQKEARNIKLNSSDEEDLLKPLRDGTRMRKRARVTYFSEEIRYESSEDEMRNGKRKCTKLMNIKNHAQIKAGTDDEELPVVSLNQHALAKKNLKVEKGDVHRKYASLELNNSEPGFESCSQRSTAQGSQQLHGQKTRLKASSEILDIENTLRQLINEGEFLATLQSLLQLDGLFDDMNAYSSQAENWLNYPSSQQDYFLGKRLVRLLGTMTKAIVDAICVHVRNDFPGPHDNEDTMKFRMQCSSLYREKYMYRQVLSRLKDMDYLSRVALLE